MFMLRSTVPSVRHLILNKTFFTFLKNCGKFIVVNFLINVKIKHIFYCNYQAHQTQQKLRI